MSVKYEKSRHPAITAGAILCVVQGVAMGFGIVPTIVYMIRHRVLPIRNLPVVGQIRALSGPFEALGMGAMILIGCMFIVLNLLHFPAGTRLWQSQRKGGTLEIRVLGLSTVFWFGFALPFPPIVGLLEAGLLAAGWKSLREDNS